MSKTRDTHSVELHAYSTYMDETEVGFECFGCVAVKKPMPSGDRHGEPSVARTSILTTSYLYSSCHNPAYMSNSCNDDPM